MATRRFIYRYATGGSTGGASPYSGYSQAALMAGDLVEEAGTNKKTGVKSDASAIGGGALKGAATGAAIGTSILPGIGTAVGAIGGAIVGGFSGASKNNELKNQLNYAQIRRNNAFKTSSGLRFNNYDQGSNTNQIYARDGGNIPSPIYVNGGKLQPLSSDSVDINGASHEQGGVELSPSVEVEGNETINRNFVYSDALPANLKGQTFAEVHRGIAKRIGKLENKFPSTITNNTLNLLRRKEEALKSSQEYLKQQLGIKPVTQIAA